MCNNNIVLLGVSGQISTKRLENISYNLLYRGICWIPHPCITRKQLQYVPNTCTRNRANNLAVIATTDRGTNFQSSSDHRYSNSTATVLSSVGADLICNPSFCEKNTGVRWCILYDVVQTSHSQRPGLWSQRMHCTVVYVGSGSIVKTVKTASLP